MFKVATKDDDYYLSCHRELNVVPCPPSWTTPNQCVGLAFEPRSEKADAEADKKTVLSAPENGLCCISKLILPTNDTRYSSRGQDSSNSQAAKAGLP
jgi:hypothetical protein